MSVLRKALEQAPSRTKASRATHQYAQMALAQTLVNVGELDEAESIAKRLLAETDEGRTHAVGAVVLGRVDQKRGGDEAVGLFRKAVILFGDVDDLRGLAWAQQNLAEELLRRYDGVSSHEIRRCAYGAMSIRLRSGESSAEYAGWLDRVRRYFRRDAGILNLIDQERARLGTIG